MDLSGHEAQWLESAPGAKEGWAGATQSHEAQFPHFARSGIGVGEQGNGSGAWLWPLGE